jgi:hypothetical protein
MQSRRRLLKAVGYSAAAAAMSLSLWAVPQQGALAIESTGANTIPTPLDWIHDRVQDHFEYLSQKCRRIKPRDLPIMNLPVLDRDLYFVHDVIAITNNAGMGSWIYYHIDDRGWIDDAARAFRDIKHPEVAEGLIQCRAMWLKNNLHDCEAYSRLIWKHDERIYRDLYQQLRKQNFTFRKPSE